MLYKLGQQVNNTVSSNFCKRVSRSYDNLNADIWPEYEWSSFGSLGEGPI